MKRTSTLAWVGLVFAALGCPPRDNEYLPDDNLPTDKLVIIEGKAQTAEPIDKTVIFERAEQAAVPTSALPDDAVNRQEPRPPVPTVEPADPYAPWPANSSGEVRQTPETTGTTEQDK